MKKYAKVLCLALAFFAGVMIFGGCSLGGKKLESIGLSTPIQKTYRMNDLLDLGSAKLVLTYSDDSQQQIELTTNMISGFDTSTCGSKTMTISYKDKTQQINYIVYTTDADIVKAGVRTKMINTDKILAQITKIGSNGTSQETYIRNGSVYGIMYDNYVQYNDTRTGKVYSKKGDEAAEISDMSMSDADIIDAGFMWYAIKGNDTRTKGTVQIVNGEYVLKFTYGVNMGPSTWNYEATITASMDFVVSKMELNDVSSTGSLLGEDIYTYTYGDTVPTITFPTI